MAGQKDLYGPDMVLMLLGAPTKVSTAKDQIHGVTRLEKLLFLADTEKGVQEGVREPLRFKAYHYGPYSKEVYEGAELLEEADLLREERAIGTETFDEMEELDLDVAEEAPVERRFFLTDKGKAVAELLLGRHPELERALSDVKDRYARMPLRQLIRYVYSTYPDYAVASRIRDQII